MESVLAPSSALAAGGDVLALTKPRVTGVVLATAATGIFLAPGHPGGLLVAATLAGTALVVGAANALNCWMEREADARMERTRRRPLAAGRLSPGAGLAAGAGFAAAGLAVLLAFAGPLPALLAALALAGYVWVYTPLKTRTPKALLAGAVPGALPPLIGWTAVTGRIGRPGLWLFLVLFLWQLPHFLAITLCLQDDYARGGFKVLPLVKGEAAARRHLLLYTALLVPASLAATPLGLAGRGYLAVAAAAGIVFLAWASSGLRPSSLSAATRRWAGGLFAYSILYLLVLSGALLLDATHG